ncbi:MAG: CD1871A family CXXC motif-containing protein [Eubacteriales bacterium]
MKNIRYIKYIIFFAAIALIIIGAMTGEAKAVLAKATKICLECIGIG